MGAGTSAGAAFGGNTPPTRVQQRLGHKVLLWSMDNYHKYNTARYQQNSAGTSQSAAIAFGGYDGTSELAVNESWDGSAWTEVEIYREDGTCRCWNFTSALAIGGRSSALLALVQKLLKSGVDQLKTGDLN